MIEDIKKMKKIELHIHLDGSVEPATIAEMSGKSYDEVYPLLVAPDKCENLSEYLTKFDLPCSFMQTKEDLTRIANDIVKYFESQNVIYAEVRFAPSWHVKEGLSKGEVIETLYNGLNCSDKVKTNLIVCLHRNVSIEDNWDTLEVVKNYIGKEVCAVDLAGAEDMYPIQEFLTLFDKCNELAIPYTIHAGENGPYSEVVKAVNIGSRRIGHGIHSIDDEDTIKLLKDTDTLLEVCPTSNVQTNSIDVYENHPIKKLYDMGVSVCINTDNKTISRVTLNDEYEKLVNTFGFTKDDFIRMNLNAINHAFLSNVEKMELINKLKQG